MFVQHVDHISFAVRLVNARLHTCDVMTSVTASTAVTSPTAVS